MINLVLDYDKYSCFRFDIYLNEMRAFIILVGTRLQQYSKNYFMS